MEAIFKISYNTIQRENDLKPKWGRMEGGRWGWEGWGQVVAGTWRQLYLNNNKKIKVKKIYIYNIVGFGNICRPLSGVSVYGLTRM